MLEGFSAKGFTDDCEQSKTGAAESVPFAGSKKAGSGQSASDAILAKADLHLAHGYDQSECGSPIMAYLHALGTLNSVRASFILDCDRFLLIASVCRTPIGVVII